LAKLKETRELIGLETANDVHIENVDDHTRSVVQRLTASDYFRELDSDAQLLCEVAAYLHDIGKGPKSRWAAKGGKQQAERDHPLRSVEMLVRILTEEIREIDPADVRSLAKLICYHDLVGDILGKERDTVQLEDISETEKDLDMLIALGMADMRAISNSWFEKHANEVPALRAQVIASLEARA
jgi:UTP:GlnB (protein PII) uridylyltransferase